MGAGAETVPQVSAGSARHAIAGARRVVVKVGSSSLSAPSGGLDPDRLFAVVQVLAHRRACGDQVVLVSSGAIAAGLVPLRMPRRPTDVVDQQAAASVGQLALAEAYVRAFDAHGLAVGQVLLTAEDVVRRASYRNAQRTLSRLLELGVVPVVNENDTVATAEIRFGDNDRLAAMVAHLVSAQALVLLSDVDALYDGDPATAGSCPIREVGPHGLDGEVDTSSGGSALGTGGMASKLAAARLAASSGIPVLLASAEQAATALHPRPCEIGTAFAAGSRRLSPRRFWLGYTASPAGRLLLDPGAVHAVLDRRSLLAAGLTGVHGSFDVGEVVELCDQQQRVIARGIVGYRADELADMVQGAGAGAQHAQRRREVVHADDLVTLDRAGRGGPTAG